VDRQRYKNLYDSSPELHRSVNADHVILDCNDSYAKELGHTKEDVIGHSVFEHTADHSLDAHHEMIDSWAKNKKVSNTELWLKRKDGSTFPVLLSSTGLHDASGKLIGSNTVIVDINEIFEARKKIEENDAKIKQQLKELKESNEVRMKSELKYRNLYDNASDLYRITNADNVIIECNRAYLNGLGYNREEVIGGLASKHMDEQSRDAYLEFVEEFKREKRVTNKELWMKRKDGSTFPSLVSATGLHDENGQLIGSHTVIIDITELHAARTKIQELEASLKN